MRFTGNLVYSSDNTNQVFSNSRDFGSQYDDNYFSNSLYSNGNYGRENFLRDSISKDEYLHTYSG